MDFSQEMGTTKTYSFVNVPINGRLATGKIPAWTVSDPLIQLFPASGGFSCKVRVPLDYAPPSFDLTVTATSHNPKIGTKSKTRTIGVTAPVPMQQVEFVQEVATL